MMTTTQIAEEMPPPLRTEQGLPDIAAAVGSTVTDLEQQATAFIRQRPVVALLAAVGVGYLVARLVSRGMR